MRINANARSARCAFNVLHESGPAVGVAVGICVGGDVGPVIVVPPPPHAAMNTMIRAAAKKTIYGPNADTRCFIGVPFPGPL